MVIRKLFAFFLVALVLLVAVPGISAREMVIKSRSVDSDSELQNCTDVTVKGKFLVFTTFIGNCYTDRNITGYWEVYVKNYRYPDGVRIERGEFIFPPNFGIESYYFSFGIYKEITLIVSIDTGEYFEVELRQILGFFYY